MNFEKCPKSCIPTATLIIFISSFFLTFKVGNFVQSEPQHENPFTSDSFLQSYLSRLLPQEIQTVIRPDLKMFGEKCATNIQVLENVNINAI